MPPQLFTKLVDRFVNEISLGLEAIHTKGFAHMDVKPSNIAIERNGTFVLIDLGSCCRFGTQTSSTTAFVPAGHDDANRFESSAVFDWWMLAMTVFSKLNHDCVGHGPKTYQKAEVYEFLIAQLAP